jgi:hypothetical protein
MSGECGYNVSDLSGTASRRRRFGGESIGHTLHQRHGIASDLPRDRPAVPSQRTRDLRRRQPLPAQRRKLNHFLGKANCRQSVGSESVPLESQDKTKTNPVGDPGRRNSLWCSGKDSNLHALRQRLLRPSCLPFHHPSVECGPKVWNGRRAGRKRGLHPPMSVLGGSRPHRWLSRYALAPAAARSRLSQARHALFIRVRI